jgi:hypothetical protein
MASFYSAWFIGSIVLREQAFTVNGVLVVVAAGTYYLSDPTAGLSLLAAVQAAMLPQAAGATAVLLGSGKVRLAGAGAFSITWGAATLLRDLLGYTGNLAASTSYTAPGKSALFFSPGKPATLRPDPLGVDRAGAVHPRAVDVGVFRAGRVHVARHAQCISGSPSRRSTSSAC